MDSDVELAFKRFNDGERPWRLVNREWYVADQNNELYPAKYIWALIIDSEPKSFNTADARRELAEREYSLIRIISGNQPDGIVEVGHESPEAIIRKAKKAKGRPKKKLVILTDYQRNPYVVKATLLRAKGRCEVCHRSAPFNRKKDDSPYLEVHHKIMLAKGGEDTLHNTVAICPNCHREAHYG
ncbi:MAG: hypothetical protein OFPII_44310 [Osedax symbiont Rs1]|nr:MAG: hypothetical protein OFPII_44310 [Osedax symbiont Rs1]